MVYQILIVIHLTLAIQKMPHEIKWKGRFSFKKWRSLWIVKFNQILMEQICSFLSFFPLFPFLRPFPTSFQIFRPFAILTTSFFLFFTFFFHSFAKILRLASKKHFKMDFGINSNRLLKMDSSENIEFATRFIIKHLVMWESRRHGDMLHTRLLDSGELS